MILITITLVSKLRAFVFIKNQRKNRRAVHTHVNACFGWNSLLNDLEAVIEIHELMSKKFFTHATPTLFNAGTPKPQMSSCFY